MKKIVVHSSDIAMLLGVSLDTSRRLLKTIRAAYGKLPHQAVTIREFCDYEGLPYDEVFALLNGLVAKQTV